MDKITFAWDKAFFEKRLHLLTNLQMGFVGAALMLMMMNLSKIYLLLPLGIGLVLASWYKHHMDSVQDEINGLEVSFSPKSLLIKNSVNSSEQRIQFREIDEIIQYKEHFVPVVAIYLLGENDKVELRGLENSHAFVNQLETALNETKAG